MIGGTDPEHGAIVDALAAIAAHGGPTGLLTALRYAPARGLERARRAHGDSARLQVRYGAEVRSVRQDDRASSSALADGTSCRAARAVLALPVNALPAIAFDPALPAATAEALGANAGRAHKVWLRARGVPAGVLAAGAGEGLHWLYADRDARRRRRAADRLRLRGPGASTRDAHADVERALRAFFPDAELVASDHHDWIGDPFSRGTWATATVGRAELLTRRALPAARPGRVRDLGRRAARGRAGSRGRCSRVRPARAGRWRPEQSPENQLSRHAVACELLLVDLDAEAGAHGDAHDPSANSKPEASTSSASCDSATVYSQ